MKGALVRIFTLSLFLTAYLLLLFTFLLAWLTPEKAIRIAVDSYGEANIEMVLLLTSFIPIIIGTRYFLNDVIREIGKKH